MDEYTGLIFTRIPKSKIPTIKNFANRHGAKLISIRPEESEENYFSAEIIAKRYFKKDVIKGILGPGYAREVHYLGENPSEFDYIAIQGD